MQILFFLITLCFVFFSVYPVRRSKDPTRQSIYKIEFGAPVDAIRGDISNDSLSPKPMTPRRVKRRSVRGTSSRSSHRRTERSGSSSGGERNMPGTSTSHRSSTRSSRRKVHHQNPVTKLIEQQNSFPSFKHNNNPTLTENNLKSLNNDYIPNPKREIATIMSSASQPVLHMFQKPSNDMATAIHRHTPTDPIYYNMNSSSPLLVQQTSWNVASTPSPQAHNSHYHHHHHHDAANLGHTNPTYQYSNPNLTDASDMNEYYQSRPPSVRSSYSNFHGTRPYSQNPTGENVFASITTNQQPQQQTQQQHFQQQHNHHSSNNANQLPPRKQQQQQPQASTSSPYYHLPQPTTSNHHHQQQYHQQQPQSVSMKRATGSRESLRFLSGAPPAYHHKPSHYNHHTPPDSETTM